MLIFWCILGVLAGLFLRLAFRKNGRRGLLRGALLLGAAALLVGLDQAVKLWARTVLQPAGTMPFIPYILQLRFVLNTGAAFSMLEGRQLFLTLFTGAVLAALGGWLVLNPPQKKLEYAGWVLILAGGVGNLIDRAANGEVVDLFDTLFMNFAVFNVADICITVGFCLLILFYLLAELAGRKEKGAAGAKAPDMEQPAAPQTAEQKQPDGEESPDQLQDLPAGPDARGQDETA